MSPEQLDDLIELFVHAQDEDDFKKFIGKVTAIERERCAQLAESSLSWVGENIAATIRGKNDRPK